MKTKDAIELTTENESVRCDRTEITKNWGRPDMHDGLPSNRRRKLRLRFQDRIGSERGRLEIKLKPESEPLTITGLRECRRKRSSFKIVYESGVSRYRR